MVLCVPKRKVVVKGAKREEGAEGRGETDDDQSKVIREKIMREIGRAGGGEVGEKGKKKFSEALKRRRKNNEESKCIRE